MSCDKMSDTQAWIDLLSQHVDLQECFRYILDRINFEIPQLNLGLASQILNALNARFDFMNTRIGAIDQEIGCIRIMFGGIPPINPDFVNFLSILAQREAALLIEQQEIRDALASLPAQIAHIKAVEKELACQKYNANYLDGILRGVLRS
jgi:hypothetical protein